MQVIVVGAGLLGITTAWFLRQHGMDVTVLDQREGPALEASWGNGGYGQSGYPEPWNIPGIHKMLLPAWKATLGEPSLDAAMLVQTNALVSLAGWGVKFLRNATPDRYRASLLANRRLATYTRITMAELDRELGLDYAQRNNGGLWVFRDQAELDQYAKQVSGLGDESPDFAVLDRQAVVAQEPALVPVSGRLVGGIHFPGEVSGDPYRFCKGLAAAAEQAGVIFEFSQSVKAIKLQGKSVQVETSRGAFSAQKLVIAAGAHSPTLSAMVGAHLPIRPAKGYSISVPMRGWGQKPKHMVADMGLHAGASPMGDFLRVAGIAEFSGFDEAIDANRIDSLFRLVEQIYPGLAEVLDRDHCQPWTGFRPLSADGRPFVGDSGKDNVYLNTGHGGLGWTLAAGSAKALADHMSGHGAAINLGEFRINR